MPEDIDIDSENRLYTVEKGNHRIRIFKIPWTAILRMQTQRVFEK